MDSVEAAVDSTLPASDEASEGTANTPTADSGSEDLRAEMIAFAKGGFEEGEEKTEEPAPEAKASEPTEEAPEKSDEPEVEAKADESDEDKEAEADSGDEPEKPKKQSGWQKAKKKIEERDRRIADLEKKATEYQERDSKWEHVTSLFQSRLEEAESRASRAEARLQELGAGPDPSEGRIRELERQLREQAAERERQSKEDEARQAQEAQQRQRQSIAAIKAQVAKVAEAHGLEPDALAARAAAASSTAKYLGQPPPSLEDVAAEVVALQRLKTGTETQRQADVSQSAPRPVRGTAPSPTAPKFDANSAGGLAYLRSQGLI